MKYLVLVDSEIFKKLNEKPDYSDVFILKDEEVDGFINQLINVFDTFKENN